jgi:hypothetical protein
MCRDATAFGQINGAIQTKNQLNTSFYKIP